MRAMVLAAGRSSRLKSAGSKVLIKVKGRTLLEHNLRFLKKQGIREIVVNLHYQSERIQKYLKRHKNFGMKITYSYEPRLLGTAGAVKKMEGYFKKKDFLVLYGDNLSDFSIKKLMRDHKKNKALMTLGIFNPQKANHSGILSGLITLDKKDRIKRFIEKRNNNKVSEGVVSGGIGIYSPKILKWIPDGRPYDFAKNLYPRLLRAKKKIHTSEAKVTYVLASDNAQALKETRRLAKRLIKGKH